MLNEDRIAEITTDLDGKLQTLAAASQAEFLSGLRAGETAPKFGRYTCATDTARELAAQAKADAITEIEQVLKSDASSVRQRRTQRVDPRDRATVEVALARQNLSDDELRELYDEFGNNYQLAQIIAERGRSQGVMLGMEQDAADLDAAMAKAAQYINTVGQYGNDTFFPSVVSDSIAHAYNHTDIFGRRYD